MQNLDRLTPFNQMPGHFQPAASREFDQEAAILQIGQLLARMEHKHARSCCSARREAPADRSMLCVRKDRPKSLRTVAFDIKIRVTLKGLNGGVHLEDTVKAKLPVFPVAISFASDEVMPRANNHSMRRDQTLAGCQITRALIQNLD
ncbi:MAG TPA: hypothetical protein VGP75_16140 [Yoonia sp.]|nr:hypothetical protein [Yoonia sp.]